ncbi:AN1-type zinc finger protein 2A [Microcaecilia unicolor]|uniref:AN1-type zinc finger protein 2A n=1 Tax=Microcaecilia unicolor TaxID=1415580 RepID=A0A6P7Z0C3_9AMPH|nr:AN1-type zinc finger protein 2A [Microcaecilia unicolor]
MEFPDLGKQCSENTCKQLDFLPLKCNACEQVFCKDHITYSQHKCTSAYKKDVQVPVCPLCNIPIPVRKGVVPDIAVGEHIEQKCKYNPSQHKQKIFTNKCLKPGCKKRELIKMVCDQCQSNFCIKHRHPLDHECSSSSGSNHPHRKAGCAAILRTQDSLKTSSKMVCQPTIMEDSTNPHQNRSASWLEKMFGISQAGSLQNELSEEAVLQRALELSLEEWMRNCSITRPLGKKAGVC